MKINLQTRRCFHRLCVNDEGEVISFRMDPSCYYFEVEILPSRSVNKDVYEKKKETKASMLV